MAYSTQRGYGRNHPFVGELRIGTVAVEMEIPELGFAIEIGEVVLTECETVNQFTGSKTEPPQFTRGYGLVFGHVRAQGDLDGAGRPRAALGGTGRGRRRRAGAGRGIRPLATPTTSRRPAFSNTSSCRITSTSSRSWS